MIAHIRFTIATLAPYHHHPGHREKIIHLLVPIEHVDYYTKTYLQYLISKTPPPVIYAYYDVFM